MLIKYYGVFINDVLAHIMWYLSTLISMIKKYY